MLNCKMVKRIPAPSSEGGIPCELCDVLDNMGEKLNEFARTFNTLKKTFEALQKTHKRCNGCGLCFGGHHVAFPKDVPGIGEVCQWCAQEIKDKGLETFKERRKPNDD